MPKLQDHPLAAIFPLMPDDELAELADDIEANGLRDPIWLLDGKILDGRNRYRACELKDIDARVEHYKGKDALGFVISRNLHRRHLTASQRAMAAARTKEIYEEQAKERQKESGKIHGRGKEKVVENFPQPISGKARDQAGEALNVSGKSVDAATKVIEEGIPELAEAVDKGKLPVSTAAKAADLPKNKQREIAKSDNPKKAANEALKEEKQEEAASQPKEPIEFVAEEVQRFIRLTDALKREVEKTSEAEPLFKKFVHVESITAQYTAARKALFQSKPTEPCNCTRGNQTAAAECKACFGTGKCPPNRVLKGGR